MDRHLIYTNGRSGSNALTNLLKQHPHVVNYGEVLGPWTTPGKYLRPLFRGPDAGPRYLDFILGSRPAFTAVQALSYLNRRRTHRPVVSRRWRDTRTIGVKEFTVNFHRNGLEHYLADHPELRLVVLLRENTVERFVSNERLRLTGVVAASAHRSDATQRTIRIDPERVVPGLDRLEREQELLREAARDHRGPTMLLRYEEYFALDEADLRRATDDLQRFLGVEPLPLATAHRKLRRGRLADSIENYAEFHDLVAATPYARWLD